MHNSDDTISAAQIYTRGKGLSREIFFAYLIRFYTDLNKPSSIAPKDQLLSGLILLIRHTNHNTRSDLQRICTAPVHTHVSQVPETEEAACLTAATTPFHPTDIDASALALLEHSSVLITSLTEPLSHPESQSLRSDSIVTSTIKETLISVRKTYYSDVFFNKPKCA